MIIQQHTYTASENETKKNCISSILKKRMINQQNNFNVLREKMSYMAARLSNIARRQSSLSWLTVLPRLYKCSLVSQKQNFGLQYL